MGNRVEIGTIITAYTGSRHKEGRQCAGPSTHPFPPGFPQTFSLAVHALPESLPSTKHSCKSQGRSRWSPEKGVSLVPTAVLLLSPLGRSTFPHIFCDQGERSAVVACVGDLRTPTGRWEAEIRDSWKLKGQLAWSVLCSGRKRDPASKGGSCLLTSMDATGSLSPSPPH